MKVENDRNTTLEFGKLCGVLLIFQAHLDSRVDLYDWAVEATKEKEPLEHPDSCSSHFDVSFVF
jgi:hypothetical protein